MAASYPTAVKTFATRSSGQTIGSAHVNDLQDEVNAMQAALLTTGLAHHLLFVDATYDIGDGTHRPRDFTISRNATIGGTLGVTGVTTLAGALVGAASQDVFNTVSATVNAFGAGTAVTHGAATGYTNIRHTLFVNDTSNAKMTTGLTINQGAADNEIVALKSSDVDHGITDSAETDTYGAFSKVSGAVGGLTINGFTEGTGGLYLGAFVTTENATKNAGADAAITLNVALKSGTGGVQPSANTNLVVVSDNAGARFIIDRDGDTFQDGTAGTYSEFDDAMLALAMEHHMNPKQQLAELFRKYCQYNQRSLIDAGLLGEDGPNGKRGFVNMSGMTRLAIGAAWQNGLAIRQLTRALLAAGVVSVAQLEAA
jgi:hypothetical protein